MTLILRVAALVGYVAYRVDLVVGRVLGFLPFRVPGALVVAVLLGLLAWSSAQATTEAIAERPRPTATSVTDLVEDERSAWVEVSGLLSGPHLDSSIYASDRDTHFLRIADDPHDHVVSYGEQLVEPGWRRRTIVPLSQGDGVTRWFYVLRDAAGSERALVVRSVRDGEAIRARSVRATGAGSVDGRPLLVEIADAGAAHADRSLGAIDAGSTRTFRVTFGDATERPCDGGDACVDGRTWRYLVTDAADAGSTAWIDSPHPPDALPVTLDGVTTTDASRLRLVLDTGEMRAALDGLRHPDTIVLADGIGPVLPEPSYATPVVLATIAGLLVLSALIGYPIFRRERSGTIASNPRPVIGEAIRVNVAGVLPGTLGERRLGGAAAALGWLPARELVRRAWHLRNAAPDASDPRPRLALLALEGNFVLPIEPLRDLLRAQPGRVGTSTGVRPALRIVGPGVRAVLAFGSRQDRDRARVELDPATGPPPAGPLPAEAMSPSRVVRRWAASAAVVALGGTSIVTAVAGAAGFIAGDAPPIGTGMVLLAAVALATLAIGVARRSPLAVELLPSTAMLGVVVSAVMVAAASTGCGSWLIPDFDGCVAFDPLRLVGPLIGIVAFVVGLWAAPHLSRAGRP